MKFVKPLLMLFASTSMLVSCNQGGSNPSSSEPSSSQSSSSEAAPRYLDFIEQGKLRVDLFNVDVQVSFGNSSLSQATNTVDLVSSNNFSVNQNSTLNYYIIMFAEKVDGSTEAHAVQYYTPEGEHLVEFFELGRESSFFQNYNLQRGYVAISTGTEAQWTKGLNAAFDAEVQNFIRRDQ